MWLETLAIALCVLTLAAVVIMVLVALIDIVDPTTITRCRGCSRWMVDTHPRPEPTCFHCRHAHRAHNGHSHLNRFTVTRRILTLGAAPRRVSPNSVSGRRRSGIG